VDGRRGGIRRLLPRLPVKRNWILPTLKAISVGPVRMTHGWRLGGMLVYDSQFYSNKIRYFCHPLI